ncbi:MAG: hypothetical protein NVS2B2_31640 [Ktedonobacteraceae bacterium]
MANPQVAPTRSPWRAPNGTINVFDPSPLNWLFITWNTMEEPIRVDQEGHTVPALATDARWLDDHTLELALRTGQQDKSPLRNPRHLSTRDQHVSPAAHQETHVSL